MAEEAEVAAEVVEVVAVAWPSHLGERVDELGERDPLVEEPRRRELGELEAGEHVRRRPLVVEEERDERRVGVAGRDAWVVVAPSLAWWWRRSGTR